MNGTEEIFFIFVLWCAINTLFIFFAYARSSNNDTKKIKEDIKEIKDKHNKMKDIVFPVSNFCLSYYAEQELKFEMYKLKQEGYNFPFENYDFDSFEFNKLSQNYFGLKDKISHHYEEFPYELFIKDVFLPHIKYDYPEEVFINDLKEFIKNNNDKIKVKE